MWLGENRTPTNIRRVVATAPAAAPRARDSESCRSEPLLQETVKLREGPCRRSCVCLQPHQDDELTELSQVSKLAAPLRQTYSKICARRSSADAAVPSCRRRLATCGREFLLFIQLHVQRQNDNVKRRPCRTVGSLTIGCGAPSSATHTYICTHPIITSPSLPFPSLNPNFRLKNCGRELVNVCVWRGRGDLSGGSYGVGPSGTEQDP